MEAPFQQLHRVGRDMAEIQAVADGLPDHVLSAVYGAIVFCDRTSFSLNTDG